MRYLFPISWTVLLLATIARAQTPGTSQQQKPEESWGNLRSLGVGEKVHVVDQKLKSLDGTFRSFSDEAVTFQVGQDEVTVQRPEVLRVTSLERARRGRNAAIGFVIGAGLTGALMAATATSRGLEDFPPAMIPVGIAAYGAVGAGIGAIVPSHKTIYRAERRKDQTAP